MNLATNWRKTAHHARIWRRGTVHTTQSYPWELDPVPMIVVVVAVGHNGEQTVWMRVH